MSARPFKFQLLRTLSIDDRIHSQFEEEVSQIDTKTRTEKDMSPFQRMTENRTNEDTSKDIGGSNQPIKTEYPSGFLQFRSESKVSYKFIEKTKISGTMSNERDLFSSNEFRNRFWENNNQTFDFNPVSGITDQKRMTFSAKHDDEETRKIPFELNKPQESGVQSKDFGIDLDWSQLFQSPEKETRRKLLSSQIKSRVKHADLEFKFPASDDLLLDLRKFSFKSPKEKPKEEENFLIESQKSKQSSKHSWQEGLTLIMKKYINSEKVKQDPKYVQMWLDFCQVAEDPEEVLIYMFSRDIGTLTPQFYSIWMGVYIQEKEYLYTFEVLSIFENKIMNVVEKSKWKGSGIKSKVELKHHLKAVIQNIKSELEWEIISALKTDFYQKDYFVDEREGLKPESYSRQRRLLRKYGILPGISKEDFKIIKEKSLQKKISKVLEIVYGFDEIYCKRLTDSIKESGSARSSESLNNITEGEMAEEILNDIRVKRETFTMRRLSRCFKRSLSIPKPRENRKRLSDLISKKKFHGSHIEVYIEEKYRGTFENENILALEYEYYKKKYDFDRISVRPRRREVKKNRREWGDLDLPGQFLFPKLRISELTKSYSFIDPISFFIKDSNRKRVQEMLQKKILAYSKKSKKKSKIKNLRAKKVNSSFQQFMQTNVDFKNLGSPKVIKESEIHLSKLQHCWPSDSRKSLSKELPRDS